MKLAHAKFDVKPVIDFWINDINLHLKCRFIRCCTGKSRLAPFRGYLDHGINYTRLTYIVDATDPDLFKASYPTLVHLSTCPFGQRCISEGSRLHSSLWHIVSTPS